MEIKLREYLSIYILDIIGEIDLYNCQQLKEIINKLIAKNISSCILNFEQVTYIDSSGVGALIYTYTNLKNNQIKFYLTHLSGSVKRVIELTKLNKYLPIEESIANAVNKIKGN